MMVALCVSCQMKLEIRYYSSVKLIKSDTISGNIANNKWFHYKTCFNIGYDKVHLTVNRLNDRSTVGYWALNEIDLLEQDKGKTIKSEANNLKFRAFNCRHAICEA